MGEEVSEEGEKCGRDSGRRRGHRRGQVTRCSFESCSLDVYLAQGQLLATLLRTGGGGGIPAQRVNGGGNEGQEYEEVDDAQGWSAASIQRP